MRICIPIQDDRGLDSVVCDHFGSAPAFMIVDVESRDHRAIANDNRHHGHGMCQPLAMLTGEQIDAVVVGGIGMGALARLLSANLGVFRAQHGTVAETVAAYRAGTLQPITPGQACGHHGSHHA
jgi:predicted Fe-Mo cluster-binding NifX family protein